MNKAVFFVGLVLCYSFSLVASEQGDGAGEKREADEREGSFGRRSISASPRSFFDLEVLALLSQQLHPCAVDRARIDTPSSAPTPREHTAREQFMAVSQERSLGRLQRQKIRAAIADIRVPGMSPVFDHNEMLGKRTERDEQDQDMTEVAPEAPSAKMRCAVNNSLPEDGEVIEECMDQQ